MKPTNEQYSAINELFDYFNRALFNNSLPYVLFTFKRHKKILSEFIADAWKDDATNLIHEIAINPLASGQGDEKFCQMFVHELTHLWQTTYGKNNPPRHYHNKEYSAKLQSIGLMPSHTGKPGGKTSGQALAQYTIENGKFQITFSALPKHILLPLTGIIQAEKSKTYDKSKATYHCPECSARVYGQPGIWIICGECEIKYVEKTAAQEETPSHTPEK